MADEEHLAILWKGVEVWNSWRNENPDVRPDLSGADLFDINLLLLNRRPVNLSQADLRSTNLRRASLRGAKLFEADLNHADLSHADLSGADLRRARFRRANLSKANLTGADLSRADLFETDLFEAILCEATLSEADLLRTDLTGADLTRADLSRAAFGWTAFANLDLSEVHGLDTVFHNGPSTISVDTVYKSGGNIPEVFLRGCGVPDTFITFMASLVGKAIEFYSCFISHSMKDQDFAHRLHNDLQAKGVRCWFAPEDVQGGKKLHEQIEEAIHLYDKLLLVLSEHSMNSEWVKTEIYHARQQEIKRNRRKLFPISLAPFEIIRSWKAFDADTGKDMAREVREYFIPDFSNWKDHDAYQKAFDRLVRDLKAESASEGKP